MSRAWSCGSTETGNSKAWLELGLTPHLEESSDFVEKTREGGKGL